MDLPPGYLAEAYRAFSSISAVLGGFSIAFLVIMTSGPATSRAASWATGTSAVAVACFLPACLGMFFASFAAGQVTSVGDLPAGVTGLTGMSSLLVVIGTYALLACLGLCGWVRSRAVGRLTTGLAVLSALACTRGVALLF